MTSNASASAERDEQAGEVLHRLGAAPGRDGAFGERQRRVGDQQLLVDLELGAQTGAGRAGTERRVEGERPRLELVEGQVVVQAGEVLGEGALAVGVGLVEVDEVEGHQAAAQDECGLDRVGQPALGGRLDAEPVDHDLDVVLLVLLQLGRVGERDDGAVDPRPRVALGLQLAEQLGVLALAAADDRREDLEPVALGQLEDAVDDLLRGLAGDVATALGAVRVTDAGIEQTQVVVHLGDGADGGARVAVGGLLVDRDGRREPLDEVDVGLVHLAEELPGVGGQRLDVATLALREDRVEGEARLAGARQPGEDDQRVAWKVERDVLEVVLTRSAHDQTVSHEPGNTPPAGQSPSGNRPVGPSASITRGSDSFFPSQHGSRDDLHRRRDARRTRPDP